MSRWRWFGHAAHFICGRDCRFHLATQVGPWLVSTVGEYWPARAVREIHAEVHDAAWLAEHAHLKGDYFDAAYMERFGYQEIGYERTYETMVFKAGAPCRDVRQVGGARACGGGGRRPGGAHVRRVLRGREQPIEASVDCHDCDAKAGELHRDGCDTYALYFPVRGAAAGAAPEREES